MESEFGGKTVLVTGGGTGIGRATAIAFARQGAHLILIGRTRSTLDDSAAEVRKWGGTADVAQFDLCDEKKTHQFFTNIKHLDVAVNNAGTEGRIAEISQLRMQDFDEAMTGNVRSLFQCLQEEINVFRRTRAHGSIVNVSSVAGMIGIPTSSLYVASKHAVIGLTKSVALEQIRHGIRINTVCPGGVATPMLERIFPGGLDPVGQTYPIGRVAKPEEIADAILWLCSRHSSYVVGHSLVVDGGRTVE